MLKLAGLASGAIAILSGVLFLSVLMTVSFLMEQVPFDVVFSLVSANDWVTVFFKIALVVFFVVFLVRLKKDARHVLLMRRVILLSVILLCAETIMERVLIWTHTFGLSVTAGEPIQSEDVWKRNASFAGDVLFALSNFFVGLSALLISGKTGGLTRFLGIFAGAFAFCSCAGKFLQSSVEWFGALDGRGANQVVGFDFMPVAIGINSVHGGFLLALGVFLGSLSLRVKSG